MNKNDTAFGADHGCGQPENNDQRQKILMLAKDKLEQALAIMGTPDSVAEKHIQARLRCAIALTRIEVDYLGVAYNDFNKDAVFNAARHVAIDKQAEEINAADNVPYIKPLCNAPRIPVSPALYLQRIGRAKRIQQVANGVKAGDA